MDMTLVGGWLGAYAILLRGGNFGSAQTGNLIEMMLDIVEWDLFDLGVRLLAAVIFALALVLSTLLSHRAGLPMKTVTLLVEAAGMVVAALLPTDMNAVVALYPIFFISSFQWGTFNGAEGYSCSTIFSTNNLRQSVTAWVEYRVTGETTFRDKAVFYTQTVCCFLLGALLGGACSLRLGVRAMLLGLIPVGSALIMNELQRKAEQ